MAAWPDTQDFALIGHQESWEQTSRFVHTLRTPDKPALSVDTLRDIVPWIPPRRVMHLRVGSVPDGGTVNGVYIETFITPDELGAATLRLRAPTCTDDANRRREATRPRHSVRQGALQLAESAVAPGRAPRTV